MIFEKITIEPINCNAHTLHYFLFDFMFLISMYKNQIFSKSSAISSFIIMNSMPTKLVLEDNNNFAFPLTANSPL